MLTKETSQWNQIPDQQRKLTALRIPTSPSVFGVYIPCFWDLKSFLSAFFCSLLCLWNSFTLLNTTVQFYYYCFSITLCDCTTVCLYNINGSLSTSQFGNNSNFATVNTFVHVETHIHTKIHKYIYTHIYISVGVEFLGLRIFIYSPLVDDAKPFSKLYKWSSHQTCRNILVVLPPL